MFSIMHRVIICSNRGRVIPRRASQGCSQHIIHSGPPRCSTPWPSIMPTLTAFLNKQFSVQSELDFYCIFECSGPELDAYRQALNSSAIFSIWMLRVDFSYSNSTSTIIFSVFMTLAIYAYLYTVKIRVFIVRCYVPPKCTATSTPSCRLLALNQVHRLPFKYLSFLRASFPHTETLELNSLPSVWRSYKMLMAQARNFPGKLSRLR
jgi:hypothetical protein